MGKLVKVDGSLSVKGASDINEYLKPLSRDILLFTTKIANTYKLKDKAALMALKAGERLDFKRVASKYEDSLIVVLNEREEAVGYIPEADSAVFAKLMDAGKMLFAKVKAISHASSIPLIEIDIFLHDF